MATLEGTRLPGNFTLCEDLPGEIMASKLSAVSDLVVIYKVLVLWHVC